MGARARLFLLGFPHPASENSAPGRSESIPQMRDLGERVALAEHLRDEVRA